MKRGDQRRREAVVVAELARVARVRRKLDRLEAAREAARVELGEAMLAAHEAGATLRPLAEAAGLSLTGTRKALS